MRITKYAQSTVQVELDGKKLLIDPGSYNFESGRLTREDFTDIDVLIVTHKHADHFDLDAVKAIHRNAAPVILTTAELADVLMKEGIESSVLNVGQTVEHHRFTIQGVRADHVVRGEVIDIFAVLLEAGGRRIYHASDTFYFDPKPTGVDLVFVPINNRGVAMNFEEAARFVRDVVPRIAVPIHYDSPKDSHIVPADWARLLEGEAVEVKILGFAEHLDL